MLRLRYRAASDARPEAIHVSSLIVSVPKGDYRSVIFIEDGKEVGRAKTGRSGD